MLILRATIILLLHVSCAKEETQSEEYMRSKTQTLPFQEYLRTRELPSKEKPEKNEEPEKKEEEPIVNSLPHVIVILADDLGWNDVSFHGSPQIPTPNIDSLAANSIILNNYYTESYCAQSRASLMSGQYPIHLGLQHSKIESGEPIGLPLDVMIMPEHFKNKGYSTYMVGKWNLGYFMKDYTPTYRGFDSFFGFYNEQIDYYDYTNFRLFQDPTIKSFYGIDLQEQITPVKNFRGRYATEVFTEKAVDIIQNHNESNPLFLYMAHLAPHPANSYMSLQAPIELVSKNSHIQDPRRRVYAGMVSALDDSVGKIVEVLSKRSFLNNSIIVFTSDNGGGPGKSSNWPLRGLKGGTYEGAIRVPSYVWSPLLKLKESRTSNQLMHISDWLPSLYSAVGGDISDLGKIDGYNMWNALINNLPSPRIEILHNIDPVSGTAALRRGDYKLITGSSSDGNDLWYGADLREDMILPFSVDDWVFKNDTIVKKILEDSGLWLVKSPDSWRNDTSVICAQPAPMDNAGCEPNSAPCLFNVAADPCEYNNLASRYPRIVRSMMRILLNYNATSVEPLLNSTDINADPRCHSFTYVPWLDEEYNVDCSDN